MFGWLPASSEDFVVVSDVHDVSRSFVEERANWAGFESR